jgi:mono/diheme cytochrome c family protein
MIWLKRLGYLLGGIVALLMLAMATIYAITTIRFRQRYDVLPTAVPVTADSASLSRGRHLAVAIGKCSACHGADLGGELMGDNAMFGRLASANLTAGTGGAAARYDDATLARAIRHGIRGDGKSLFLMPSESYQRLSDEDVGALIAYLRSLPPVDREHPARRAGPLVRVIYLVAGMPLLPARLIDHSVMAPAKVPREPTAEYGNYLVNIGGCTGCHGPGLSGGKLGPGSKPAANLTPAGIGSWTEADFVRALRSGVRPGGVAIDSTVMPWPQVGLMTDGEIHAMWLYLRSIPPKEFGNR